MPFSPQSLEEKPYNLCLNCKHIGKRCDGPNFLSMSTERWCEWCKLRKEYLGWTNAGIAELAEISKISVDRVMSGNVKDLRISTMQAITKALVNGSWGKYPCFMASEEEPSDLASHAASATAECDRLRADLDKLTTESNAKIDYLKEQVKFKEAQMLSKDRQLEERYDFLKRKDRVIAIQSVLLSLALIVIITALIVDKTNPGFGFFW